MYSDKNAKYLFYRFNSYLESTHQPNKCIRHTKKGNDKFSLEKIQNVNWQYFLTVVIKQVDKPKKEILFDKRSLYIFENILSNYRVEGRVYAVLYQQIAESFKRYLESLDFDDIQTLNLDLAANGGGIQPIENYSDSVELLQVFDLFYYINGRLPYTTGLLPIPDGDFMVLLPFHFYVH